MPKKEKKSTLLRQWELMRRLSVSRSDTKHEGHWDKASEITTRLNASGYTVSVRTVQRDLKELSEIFPIECNDKNPRDYGWRWTKGANLDIPGMSVSEALAMRMVEIHLKKLLPDTMLGGLDSIFRLAKSKLDNVEKQNNDRAKNWLNKIRVVPPAQPLLPPKINQQIQANIYQALLESKQVTAMYQPASSDHAKEYLLHPLGLIMRGAVSYLVASARNYSDVQLYALHRFSSIEILASSVKIPKGFNLDEAIANGLADFASHGKPIQLEIQCNEWVTGYLTETPLSVDQTILKNSGGCSLIRATVNDTWQLRWWLMGQGAGLEVCAPAELRSEMKSALKATVRLYNSD